MVTRLGPTGTATRMGVTAVVIAVLVGMPAAMPFVPVVLSFVLVLICIAAGCLLFLRHRTSVRLANDILFARGWLLYHQYRRAELRPEPTTAAFRFLGTSGVVPVVTTTTGQAVRLWGLAEKTPTALTPPSPSSPHGSPTTHRRPSARPPVDVPEAAGAPALGAPVVWLDCRPPA